MPTQYLVAMLVVIGIAVELQVPMWGIPEQDMIDIGINTEGYPPWHMLWPPFFVDILCKPFGCSETWRDKYVPFGLAEKGGWFSKEFDVTGVVQLFPEQMTFEKFRSLQGYDVQPGSGFFAGLNDDLNNITEESFEEWKNSVYEYAFETPSTSLGKLTTPTALGTILLLVCCIKLLKASIMPQFEKLGRYLALKAHGEVWLSKNQTRIIKFAEYVYRLCYHSFISLVGCYLFWDAPWWNEEIGGTRNLYVDWPQDPIKPSMAWYYLFQAAYNVDAMISLLQLSFQVKLFPKDSKLPITIGWASTVRGDFNEMMAHHVVTNGLIFFSSYLYQTRIGSMVFWMHDISDVPVDLAKLANFVKWKNGTIFFFITLCITWAYTRLWVLPAKIWWSIIIHGQEVGRTNPNFGVYFYAFQPVFMMGLGALVLLHTIWFGMFIRMAILLVTKGETHDLSEHKKGEKQDTSSTTNGTSSPHKHGGGVGIAASSSSSSSASPIANGKTKSN